MPAAVRQCVFDVSRNVCALARIRARVMNFYRYCHIAENFTTPGRRVRASALLREYTLHQNRALKAHTISRRLKKSHEK